MSALEARGPEDMSPHCDRAPWRDAAALPMIARSSLPYKRGNAVMNSSNMLKKRLKEGKACVNAWLAIPSGFSA